MDGFLQEEEEDIIQDHCLDHAPLGRYLQQADQTEEEVDNPVRDRDRPVEEFCKTGVQPFPLHNSLVCIEFWHKFLSNLLAMNFP